jgi:hypothetical protein
MEYEAATAESPLQCAGVEITLEKEGSRGLDGSELLCSYPIKTVRKSSTA